MFRRHLRRRGLAAGVLLGLASVGCSAEQERPRSGVLITIDTTNTQALDIYGKDRGLTPNLARLAEASVVYDRAHTSAPITLPAHASMMTGLYPLRHGVRDNGLMQLTPDADTLAERARSAGFQTAAFVSAAVLMPVYGLDQGFDVYQGPPPAANRAIAAMGERRSGAVTDAALAWIGEMDPSRPFFLWVHYFDPHVPYDPPSEFLARAKGRPYLGEVAAMDHDIGRLLEALEALEERVGMDPLTLAVVADHGESHERHGESTHSAYCYESTIHIPFLLRFHDGRRAGERSDEMVSVVDVFPTFLEELGLGVSDGVDGISLSRGAVPEDRGVYMESYTGYLNFGWSPLSGWLDSEGKYLHSSKPEYYDLDADPHEEKNLLVGGGVDTSSYVAALDALSRKRRLEVGGGVELDEAEISELRGLGYAAAAEVGDEGLPDPLAPSDLVAPSEGAETYAQFSYALLLVDQGQNAAAAKLLRAVVAQNPNNLYALVTLGGILLDEKQYPEAVEVLERLLALDPERFLTHIYLAIANEALGNLDVTVEHYEAAYRIRPGEKRLRKEIQRVERRISDR